MCLRELVSLKERCENMIEYVKRLRLCIRWFQELELDYVFEQEMEVHDKVNQTRKNLVRLRVFRLLTRSATF
ncbi:predicted protein [Arabidopsis lyrata subsp. lyrata]|uniref:Predicted protein n=1 Tax=Arabidopsis lyrata subsp. lyrata TaxID=81972 RepID=D7MS10_ARALL|nr:predicted protein [Arabidopsis lyrata subsp. lyrata]